MPRSRQLAAIMFTDIKGYTALMQQDEDEAVKARKKHRSIFNSITDKYNGKVLQYYGDGTLSIFDSAVDAVKCGIEMQLGFREAPAIPVRIGIHTGDIFFSEEDIVGDSVNVASRIESLAVPGSVFVSEKAYDEIKNQSTIKATRLQAFRLKNVETPVVVYAIANEGLVVPRPEDIEGKTEKAPPATEEQAPGKKSQPLLATKLFTPPPRPNAVARPRLIRRLNEGLSGRLSLLSAPAGFGKTTLASEWAAGSGLPVAWLSLDERDSNLTRFLTYLTAALQVIDKDIGKGVSDMLHAPQPPPAESILTQLLNEVAIIQGRFILVLDDYHIVDSKAVDQALGFLLEHMPPQMHLAITTREDPQLPLSRLRVRGQLTELRVEALRFTTSEAASFLNQAMGLSLSEEDIAALESRTEGWIAGLQMAALSMQGRADTAAFIQAFTGSHRFILDYLAEEVLHSQPDTVRNFLIQTAILERLCGPLCDAVTGSEGGKAMLDTLERGNLFVIPLDDERQWYRYHHLFADVLMARLMEEQPGQLPGLHRRASVWYEHNGSPADAIRHALAGKDFERAAGLIERAWPEMDGNFESAAWLRWVQALPDALIRARPVLLVGIAWAHLNDGEMEAGEARLREAEQWLARQGNGDQQPTGRPAGMAVTDEAQFQGLPASIAIARAYLSQSFGDAAGTVKYAQHALSLLPENEYIMRGQAAALQGLTHWASGALDEAHQALTDTMSYFQIAGNIQFALSVTYGIAEIRATQGRLNDAFSNYEYALMAIAEQHKAIPRGTADLYLGLSGLFRERGDLAAATLQFQKSEELGPSLALPDWPYRLCVAKARLKEATGEPEAALALLDEAERLYFRTPMPNVRPVAALKARLWAIQGRLDEALAWVHTRKLSADDNLSFLQEFEHLTLARVLIGKYHSSRAEETIIQAMRLLERLLEAAEEGGRMGNAIEILVQQALARAAQGEKALALAALERALALAEPEGYFQAFADEGQPMARLLREAAARGIMPDYTGKLLAAFDAERTEVKPAAIPTLTQGHPAPVRPLIEPLSQRELEILQLIAQGLSNKEISERLFLALSTVKGHNKNIFGKLEAQRRTEALVRARELGLL